MIKKIFPKIKGYLKDPVRCFIVLSQLSFTITVLCFLLSKGRLIRRFFYLDGRDTLMDHMHSIEFLKGNDPYGSFKTLYPPLANLYYRLIYLFIPESVTEVWPDSYAGETFLRETEFDLRTYQSTLLTFIISLILFVWLFSLIINLFFSERAEKDRSLLSLALIFSYGIITCIERGNNSFFAIAMLIVYVFYRRSENKTYKEMAIILLAISAGLKIYPALYGILLLKDKDYRTSIKAIGYGIMSLVLPMFSFKGGFIENFKIWFSVLFNFTDTTYRLAAFRALVRLYGLPIPMTLFETILPYAKLLIIVILLFGLWREKKESVLLLYIASIIYIVTGEMYYIHAYFVISILSFMKEEREINRDNFFLFAILLLLVLPLPVFYEINRLFLEAFVMVCIAILCLQRACFASAKR